MEWGFEASEFKKFLMPWANSSNSAKNKTCPPPGSCLLMSNFQITERTTRIHIKIVCKYKNLGTTQTVDQLPEMKLLSKKL